jgi:hypothetical protein
MEFDWDGVIRVRRYLCKACRRTVSLLPEFVLPYLRFAIVVMAAFLRARLWRGQTLKAAAETAGQAGMPYQRGQQWVHRFRVEAESISAALSALVRPVVAGDFVEKAIRMLEAVGLDRSASVFIPATAATPVGLAEVSRSFRQRRHDTCGDRSRWVTPTEHLHGFGIATGITFGAEGGFDGCESRKNCVIPLRPDRRVGFGENAARRDDPTRPGVGRT